MSLTANRFARADADGDGFVDFNEYFHLVQPHLPKQYMSVEAQPEVEESTPWTGDLLGGYVGYDGYIGDVGGLLGVVDRRLRGWLRR